MRSIHDPRITTQQGRFSDGQLYTLKEIEELANEWIDELSPGETERTVITWRFSTFLAWLKRREKEEGGR